MPLVVTGILLNCTLSFLHLELGDTAPDCRPCLTKLCNLVGYPAWPAGRTCNNFKICKGLMHSADKIVRRPPVEFDFWPLTKGAQPPLTWLFRMASGTAFSSVHPVLSVSGLGQPGMSPKSASRGPRRTGACPYLPCPEMYVPRAGEVGFGQSYLPRLAE